MLSWNALARRQGASDVIYIRGCGDITKHDVNGWRGNTGEDTRKKMMLSGRAEMDERWHGNLFQMSEATDEKDLDLAIAVFREGMHIDKEEDRSDRVGTYRGTRAVRWDGCWKCDTLKAIVAILKFILWRSLTLMLAPPLLASCLSTYPFQVPILADFPLPFKAYAVLLLLIPRGCLSTLNPSRPSLYPPSSWIMKNYI